MPIYEYQCAKCQKTFEVWQKMSDAPPSKCQLCGAKKVSRVMSQTTFQLKGDGWYASGYAKSAEKSGAKADASQDAAADKKADKPDNAGKADKSEKKPDAKADTKSDAKPEAKAEKKAGKDGTGSSSRAASK